MAETTNNTRRVAGPESEGNTRVSTNPNAPKVETLVTVDGVTIRGSGAYDDPLQAIPQSSGGATPLAMVRASRARSPSTVVSLDSGANTADFTQNGAGDYTWTLSVAPADWGRVVVTSNCSVQFTPASGENPPVTLAVVVDVKTPNLGDDSTLTVAIRCFAAGGPNTPLDPDQLSVRLDTIPFANQT